MTDYPKPIVPVGHVEPVPRRLRGTLAGATVFDTTHALYVWEWPPYPQYYIPLADVDPGVLSDGIAARVHTDGTLDGMVRFEWNALDAWFEEDEQVFVHPRNPYARVDVLRSTRPVRIELNGVVLAESTAPVMLFETGLPPRYYLDRTAVNFDHLRPTETVTECPYKGRTSGYWSVVAGDAVQADLAWTYDYPVREVQPIAGLIAFFNEKVDTVLDGKRLPRPETPFS
jgi:uncharacterized protein (DUF427 family)